MTERPVPNFDEELRRRLGRRYGVAIDTWLDQLPPVVSDIADRWRLDLESLVQRGSMSVLIRCRDSNGRPCVLKMAPDRRRLLDEAVALGQWATTHVPAVLAVDRAFGALLMEAVEPGAPLADLAVYPGTDRVAELMTSLHVDASPTWQPRRLEQRICELFDGGLTNYERRPGLRDVVPLELYERGRHRAISLAAGPSAVLLHGDLTPVNVLDGGEDRGLVAIDPAPCTGDPAFDAVDLLLWRAQDLETICARAESMASAIGADARRLVSWCGAFAAMTALEFAGGSDDAAGRVHFLVELACAET